MKRFETKCDPGSKQFWEFTRGAGSTRPNAGRTTFENNPNNVVNAAVASEKKFVVGEVVSEGICDGGGGGSSWYSQDIYVRIPVLSEVPLASLCFAWANLRLLIISEDCLMRCLNVFGVFMLFAMDFWCICADGVFALSERKIEALREPASDRKVLHKQR